MNFSAHSQALVPKSLQWLSSPNYLRNCCVLTVSSELRLSKTACTFPATTRSCVRENQREPVGGCGAQWRKSVGGCGAQRRKAVGRGGGRRGREDVWGKTKEGNPSVAAALNGGNLWVVAALNKRRPLGGVEGDGDEKLCEGKPNKGTCGWLRRSTEEIYGWLWHSTEEGRWEGWRVTTTRNCVRENQRRELVGGCGAQRRKAVGRGGGRRRREAVWGKTKEGNLWVAAALNGGNLWVATALNGGRLLGGVEGNDVEKLCEGKPKKETCPWLRCSTEEICGWLRYSN